MAPSNPSVPSSTDDIAVPLMLLPQWKLPMDAIKNSQASHPDFFCSSSIITHRIAAAAAAAMPPKMPRLDDLLALLEVYFAPETGVLPGGTATRAELDFAEKDSPIKGEDVKPGPWLGGSSPDSVKDDGSAAVAGAIEYAFGAPVRPKSICLTGSATTARNVSLRASARLRLSFEGAISPARQQPSASPHFEVVGSPTSPLL
ncbi:hypothetical protein H9Q71_013074 [Fusarium xylarioides]|nr:hypothetical protein H9Q71_013074 [Fusarium xylarioides]